MVNLLNICCLTIVFGLCISSSCIKLNDKSVCYSESLSKQMRFYGSKTTYTIARQTVRNHSFNYEIPNCEPIMIYFIGRHAIRYPDAEDITEMSQVLPKLQQNILTAAQEGLSELCDKDLEEIRNWKLRMNETDDNRISDTGIIETKAIAKEFKHRYPSLFNLNNVKIEVGITTKERTAQTADAFLEEIKLNQSNQLKKRDEDSSKDCSQDSSEENEDKQSEQLNSSEEEKEIKKTVKPFLYFHDICEDLLGLQGVQLVKPKLVKDLRDSDLMLRLIKRVNDRLGLRANNLVNAKILKQVIRACYFEFAIYGHSAWCSALGEQELKILEYLDDIEDFYEDAYGRDINIKQTCPLIGDLLDKVQSMINNNQEKKTFLHFTHAGVMKRLYSGLGLFSDLKSNNNLKYDESICLNDEREWKSSLISPFSANFAAVLHKCDHKDTNEDQNNAKFKLLTLVQENPVIINGCDSALCSVDKFMNTYQTMSSCDLSEICRI